MRTLFQTLNQVVTGSLQMRIMRLALAQAVIVMFQSVLRRGQGECLNPYMMLNVTTLLVLDQTN